jgi:hypothetical protein
MGVVRRCSEVLQGTGNGRESNGEKEERLRKRGKSRERGKSKERIVTCNENEQ